MRLAVLPQHPSQVLRRNAIRNRHVDRITVFLIWAWPQSDALPHGSQAGYGYAYSNEDRQSQFQGAGHYCLPEERRKARNAQQIAAHESPRTTGLYDRREDDVSLDEVEKIGI